jgi:2-polyprenyl-3-methyl-5-hydroxy-6-metoxy-1,4-benzoquinol methylase
MNSGSNARAQVMHNQKVHDNGVSTYEKKHVEIYNPTEQRRIASALREAILELSTTTPASRVLDFGCGIGNLTAHLLELGTLVVASDVSSKSLNALKAKYPNSKLLETAELNGVDLSQFPDDSFDMVATYSVLHHVPDYLAAVREFVRVVRPGGVIYIDHEVPPVFWARQDDAYAKYKAAFEAAYGPSIVDRLLRKSRSLLSLSAWKRVIDRSLFGSNDEGDIHVTADDHIEWPLIERILLADCEVRSCRDFLVCRELDPERLVHRLFEDRCVDMRVLIARKKFK